MRISTHINYSKTVYSKTYYTVLAPVFEASRTKSQRTPPFLLRRSDWPAVWELEHTRQHTPSNPNGKALPPPSRKPRCYDSARIPRTVCARTDTQTHTHRHTHTHTHTVTHTPHLDAMMARESPTQAVVSSRPCSSPTTAVQPLSQGVGQYNVLYMCIYTVYIYVYHEEAAPPPPCSR